MKKRRTLRTLSVLMALMMSFSAVQSLPVAAAQAAENESNPQGYSRTTSWNFCPAT